MEPTSGALSLEFLATLLQRLKGASVSHLALDTMNQHTTGLPSRRRHGYAEEEGEQGWGTSRMASRKTNGRRRSGGRSDSSDDSEGDHDSEEETYETMRKKHKRGPKPKRSRRG